MLALLAYSQRSVILTRVMERGLEARLGADVINTYADGLHVALCGAGGQLPAPRAAVFLTHFHSDHIDGLGEVATLRWVGNGNKSPLPVFGPPSVERVVNGFNAAYACDAGLSVRAQRGVRPLLAAMRRRRALSLMKPSASC